MGNNTQTVTLPWASLGNQVGNLCRQKFNSSCRAADGRLIIPTDLETLGLRFNASGSMGDTWNANNVVAKIQAVDTSLPYLLTNGVAVSPGLHCKGNRCTISLLFNEVVSVTGSTRVLHTTWGD